MSQYTAPIEDMMFVLRHVVGLEGLAAMEGMGADDVQLVLESAGKLAGEVLAPINHKGDRQGCRLEGDAVRTPPGFKEAYAQYRDNGWNSVPFSADYGGQGLPWLMSFAIQEMWQASNTAFSLCPMLTLAAVEAIELHGTAEQKKLYLEKLVSGEWTGTMNLTEPDAGSDLGAIKAKAEKQSDGSYKIKGQKIFITYGEHDFAPNIIHMVLARTPDAPAGTRGISLFIVPKFLLDAQGNPGARNDVKCVSIEHKLGIHASPTCTMQYGDAGGATGYLVGKENEGLKYMFTMMNNARMGVGLQGVALAEAAYQHALAYARGRVQGSRLTDKTGGRVAIIEHPDVKRMLLFMKASVEAARALTYEAARAMDLAHKGDAAAQARVDLLTPVVKAWCTETAQDVASAGVQIHGGMGFIEETGAAQHFRDARILPIYEGTTGIQAMDLAFRKTISNGGAAAQAWLAEADETVAALSASAELRDLHAGLKGGLSALREATAWVLKTGGANDPDAVAAVCVPYLKVFGYVAGGVMMARAALAAQALEQKKQGDESFCARKKMTARFYATHILPQY